MVCINYWLRSSFLDKWIMVVGSVMFDVGNLTTNSQFFCVEVNHYHFILLHVRIIAPDLSDIILLCLFLCFDIIPAALKAIMIHRSAWLHRSDIHMGLNYCMHTYMYI